MAINLHVWPIWKVFCAKMIWNCKDACGIDTWRPHRARSTWTKNVQLKYSLQDSHWVMKNTSPLATQSILETFVFKQIYTFSKTNKQKIWAVCSARPTAADWRKVCQRLVACLSKNSFAYFSIWCIFNWAWRSKHRSAVNICVDTIICANTMNKRAVCGERNLLLSFLCSGLKTCQTCPDGDDFMAWSAGNCEDIRVWKENRQTRAMSTLPCTRIVSK